MSLVKYVKPSAIWLYQKLTSSVSVEQLRLGDHSEERASLLYDLAKNDQLSCFKNVILAGSSQVFLLLFLFYVYFFVYFYA